jgi:DNA-binding MarR family transcriptional regulator
MLILVLLRINLVFLVVLVKFFLLYRAESREKLITGVFIYWYMFRPVHGLLLDALLSSPRGSSVNALANRLRGKVARSIVLREVRKLAEMGLVEISEDSRHKQRKIILPNEDLVHLSSKLIEMRSEGDALTGISRMISLLRDAKRRHSNRHLIDYLKYRIKEEFSAILEVIE